MSEREEFLERRLGHAGKLVAGGLLVEAACLVSPSPSAFLVFVLVGGLLTGLGVVLYLYALVA